MIAGLDGGDVLRKVRHEPWPGYRRVLRRREAILVDVERGRDDAAHAALGEAPLEVLPDVRDRAVVVAGASADRGAQHAVLEAHTIDDEGLEEQAHNSALRSCGRARVGAGASVRYRRIASCFQSSHGRSSVPRFEAMEPLPSASERNWIGPSSCSAWSWRRAFISV